MGSRDSTLHAPTLAGPDTTLDGSDRANRRPALTILWHPDVRRIGDRALLGTRRIELSRIEPVFEPSGLGEGAPLADQYISHRTPAALLGLAGEGVELSPGDGDAPIKLDGSPLLDRVLLSPGALEAGVILTVARRVVLCLHYARTARPPAVDTLGLVGVSDAISEIRADIQRVAPARTPVLIRGETGTGKELVALAFRAAGGRAAAPFIAVNMAKIPRDRAVAEIFGYEKGAFTGSIAAYAGAFRAAHGGTLFLDELGLTPMEVQVVLLRVLEDGLVQSLGSAKEHKVDVRLIAATDADLNKAMADGSFSPALFERIARYPITLPPLRQRREDIGVLLRHLLRLHLAAHGEPDRLAQPPTAAPWLSASAVAKLALYDWPHNVRQLSNSAERIVIDNLGRPKAELSKRVRDDLQDQSPVTLEAPTGPPSDEQVAEAFKRHQGNLRLAAAELGISRTQFYEARKRNRYLPQLSTISDEDLLASHAANGGDIVRTARDLAVPVKALQDRLARLLPKRR